nr:uncharacterized protein LOC117273541 [Nicotiana tomentosiformis]
MSGMPKKVRRKEQTENKTGKLSRRGLEMTYRACNEKGHNKKGCHKTKAAASTITASGAANASTNTTASAGANAAASAGASATPKTGRGRGRPKGSTNETRPYKRPRVVGMGVLQTESGYTILNTGMPSSRPRNIISLADVTGDIGHTPSTGIKWKGKEAVTQRQLHQMREKKVIQTRSRAAQLSQGSSTIQSSQP